MRSAASQRVGLTALVAVGLFALGACSDKAGTDTTAGQKLDAAVAKTEQAGADAKAKVEELASEAKAKTESSTAAGQATAEQKAADAKESVKDASASVASTVDDAAITAQVSAGLAKDPDLSAIKIDVDTKGGAVSLTGPAPTAAAKTRAEEIAKNVKGVSSVDNQLEVKSM